MPGHRGREHDCREVLVAALVHEGDSDGVALDDPDALASVVLRLGVVGVPSSRKSLPDLGARSHRPDRTRARPPIVETRYQHWARQDGVLLGEQRSSCQRR